MFNLLELKDFKLNKTRFGLPKNEDHPLFGNLVILNTNSKENNTSFIQNDFIHKQNVYHQIYRDPRFVFKVHGKSINVKEIRERLIDYKYYKETSELHAVVNFKTNKGKNTYYDISRYNQLFFQATQRESHALKYIDYFNILSSILKQDFVNTFERKILVINVEDWNVPDVSKSDEQSYDNPVNLIYYAMKKDFPTFTGLGDIEILITSKSSAFRFNPIRCTDKDFSLFKREINKMESRLIKEDDSVADTVISNLNTRTSNDPDGSKETNPLTKDPKVLGAISDVINDPSKQDNPEGGVTATDIANDKDVLDAVAQNVLEPVNIKSTAMSKRDEELRTAQMKLKLASGMTLQELCDKKSSAVAIPTNDISAHVKTLNKNMTKVTFSNFAHVYNEELYEKDIVSIANSMQDKSIPVYIRDIKKEDSSDSLNLKQTYTFTLEDAERRRHTLKFDVPIFIDGKYMYLNGNAKEFDNQRFLKPLVKTGPDTVQVCTNYNKIFMTRYGENVEAKFEKFKNWVMTDKKRFSYKRGNCSRVNGRYKTTIEYDTLAKTFAEITCKSLEDKKPIWTFVFNQDKLRELCMADPIMKKNYEANEAAGMLSLGYTRDKSVLSIDPDTQIIGVPFTAKKATKESFNPVSESSSLHGTIMPLKKEDVPSGCLGYDEKRGEYPYGYYADGKLIGKIRVTHTKGEKFYGISWFSVYKQYRQQGIGKALFDFVINKYGRYELLLNVDIDNDIAINMYKKYGFKVTYTHKNPKTGDPFYVMTRKGKEVVDESFNPVMESGIKSIETIEKSTVYQMDNSGVNNAGVLVNGRMYRVRVEALVFKNGRIFAQKKNKINQYGVMYKIPGGSVEPNMSFADSCAKECNEEIQAKVHNMVYTGISYVSDFHGKYPQWHIEKLHPQGIKYEGTVSFVYVCDYSGKYTGHIDELDADDLGDNGSWMNPSDIGLRKEHLKAVKLHNGGVLESFNPVMETLEGSIDDDDNFEDSGIVNYIIAMYAGGMDLSEFAQYKSGKRFMYTRCKVMKKNIPLIVFLSYCEGLSTVLRKAEISHMFSDKRPRLEGMDAVNKGVIQFADGYLIYDKFPLEKSLLMNGLSAVDTKAIEYAELDSKDVYFDIFDKLFGSRILANALDNFYEWMIDPPTREILEDLNYPTEFVGLLLAGNKLLADNNYLDEIDMRNWRIRNNELVFAYAYKRIADAYTKYRMTSGNKNPVKISIPKDAVLKDIMMSTIVEDVSRLSPIVDVEKAHTVTDKGPSGTNLEQAYTQSRRCFHPTMKGVMAISTSPDANVGLMRELTLEPNIINARGYVRPQEEMELNDVNLFSAAELETPLGVTRDDCIRTSMSSKQSRFCSLCG